MRMFAKGGIATKPSIFGEDGPEIAIPLRRTKRSQELLSKANRIINGTNKEKSITINNSKSHQTSDSTTKKENTLNMNINIYGNVYGEKDLINKVGKAIFEKTKKQIPNIVPA